MRITGRQLRQIIKEELARSINEQDFPETVFSYDPEQGVKIAGDDRRPGEGIRDYLARKKSENPGENSAEMVKLFGTPDADPVASAIESRLTIDNPDAAIVAGKPEIQAALKSIMSGKMAVKMGRRSPVIAVIKAAMQSALDEICDELASKGAGSSSEGATMGLKKIITRILVGDAVDASMLKYACTAAKSDLNMGSAGPMPSGDFNESAANAAILIQHLAGLETDAVVGKDTLKAIARPSVAISV